MLCTILRGKFIEGGNIYESVSFDLGCVFGASDSCESGRKVFRQVYNFMIGQEDELDNFVTLTVYKSCKASELDATHISAIISQNQSGELPESAQVVACSGLLPAEVRK